MAEMMCWPRTEKRIEKVERSADRKANAKAEAASRAAKFRRKDPYTATHQGVSAVLFLWQGVTEDGL